MNMKKFRELYETATDNFAIGIMFHKTSGNMEQFGKFHFKLHHGAIYIKLWEDSIDFTFALEENTDAYNRVSSERHFTDTTKYPTVFSDIEKVVDYSSTFRKETIEQLFRNARMFDIDRSGFNYFIKRCYDKYHNLKIVKLESDIFKVESHLEQKMRKEFQAFINHLKQTYEFKEKP